jgi:hypothetical protein
MSISKGVTAVAATLVLALAAQGGAAGAGTVYTVGSKTVPGVNTGLVLKNGQSATVTATGAVCPWGTSACVGPNGDASVNTSTGGFLLPGASAWGLVGRVGTGTWVHVGSGPTKLSGSGTLVFAMNDNYYPDNTGSFRVTVTVGNACYPGHGYGDTNHEHCGPPGQDPDACYPGHGSGDANREHCGPPGQGSGSENSHATGNGNSGRGGGNGRP